MKIKLRKATKKDYKRVLKLFADFVEQPNRYKNFNNDSFMKVLKEPDSSIILAEKAKRIVGFIVFSKRFVVRYPKPIVEIEEFYVSPKHRRQSIGRKLMEYILAFAKKEKCQYVFLGSDKKRKIAHHFYKALNFDEYAFHYRQKL